MRIIDTGITKEIWIGDKLYTVDDRQSTFEKIQGVQANSNLTDKEKTNQIFELALGKEATKEVEDMDLPVGLFNHLTFCLMGAITGEDPAELEKKAKDSKN